MATIVIEAGEKSGALITAGFAAEQGRDVFAVPGSILAPQSKGTNRLIQDGAQPLLTPDDVLQGLHLESAGEQRTARRTFVADSSEQQVLDALGNEPLHVDEIQSQTSLPAERISAVLVMMELKGMVRQVGGMQYVAVREVQSGYSA
jgi:DNA processing protein